LYIIGDTHYPFVLIRVTRMYQKYDITIIFVLRISTESG
jgi:hypothetical protein